LAARRELAFELIPDVLFLRLIASLVAGIAVTAVASHEANANVRQLLRVYGIGVLIVNLVFADHLLTALELFHARSLLNVMQQLLYAAMIFLFVRSTRDVVWVPISILCSSILCSAIAWGVLCRNGLKFRISLQPHSWAEILRPSFHYAGSTLMSNLYHRTGHVAVRWFLGDFALGLYAAAVRLVDIVRGLIVTFCQILMPRIAVTESSERLQKLARLATSVVATASIPLTFGLIGTAQLIVPWVLGSSFVSAVPVLQWMAPYLITASYASLLCGTILFALGRHQSYLASTAAGAAAGTCSYIVLVPIFGLRGAALALVIAELVVAMTALWKLPELHGFWRSPSVGVAFASALLMLLAIRLTSAYTSQIVIVLFVGASVYVTACGWYLRRLLVHA
jgi:O-antigen/teichoic acid export membrane protein